jgi:excinuclease ABC subunit A
MKEKDKKANVEWLRIKGARTHNLKNIDVSIPRNKMTVFTGLSGSGKSSLAFDTIFAEGQRRYIESLSAYARQFLNQMPKPDVDEITGLSPAISIDQKLRSNNPRSTVATITEIYDYLRILYARVGRPKCLLCGREIKKLSNEEIIEVIINEVKNTNLTKTTKKIVGVIVNDLKMKIYAPVVVGRKGEYYQMLYDLLGKGYSVVKIDGEDKKLRERIILQKHKKHDIDVLVDEFFVSEVNKENADIRMRLSEAVEKALLESGGLIKVELPDGETKLISAKFMCPYDGFSFPEIEPRLFSFNSPYGACPVCHGLGTKNIWSDDSCEKCKGARLRDEALSVFVGDKNILELTALSIEKSALFFKDLKLTEKEKEISKVVIKEIESRLKFMIDVGIEYLTLNRKANTLSGGESQRIRLASQLGSGLVGALYVLDEPTIGLHSRDNERLIKTLISLRELGNTIIVVEHDEETIFSSDYIVDIGPGAGVHGGRIVAAGWLDDLLASKNNSDKSITLDYLRGDKKIPLPDKRRTTPRGELKITGINIFNIKNQSVNVPLGRLVAITGVSGSGKSSFMYEVLYKNLINKYEKRFHQTGPFNCGSFVGAEYANRVILIDQSPIGRTPRSNPATYTGAWSFIRGLLAETEEARFRGWKQNRFSFNVPGGRCEACQGNGEIAVEMHFLPTVYVKCDVCNGKRFMKETLEITYRGKNVDDILHMTIEEAASFFEDIPAIYDRLKRLDEVGLGYLELGQSATTLSGGEAQRVKIAAELYRPDLQKTIYLLDEPTVGLHYEDVRKLIEILSSLVNYGNTVVVIEHNMDVIKSADYIIDFGPEGGDNGGKIVAKGSPEEIANNPKSYTGQYIKRYLKT